MIAVTGCGAGTKLPAGVAARTGLTGAVEVVGNGPVDTLVAIDRTAIMHGRRDLALQYKLAAVAALDATIRRGGMLKIVLFGHAGGRPLNIRTEIVPSLDQLGDASRMAIDSRRRAQVTTDISVGLGLAPCAKAACLAIRDVTSTDGSDIARSLGDQIRSVQEGNSGKKVVVLLTDGESNQGVVLDGGTLKSASARTAANAIVHEAAVPSGTSPIALLRIAGIGKTSGRGELSPQESQRLEAIWTTSCHLLPTQRCEVSQTP